MEGGTVTGGEGQGPPPARAEGNWRQRLGHHGGGQHVALQDRWQDVRADGQVQGLPGTTARGPRGHPTGCRRRSGAGTVTTVSS
jgi:hypothetical protein